MFSPLKYVVCRLDTEYRRHRVAAPKSFFRAMHLSLYGDVLELSSDIIKKLPLRYKLHYLHSCASAFYCYFFAISATWR